MDLQLAFNLNLLFLTMILTLFGLITLINEGLGYLAGASVILCLITVFGLYHIIMEKEKQNQVKEK